LAKLARVLEMIDRAEIHRNPPRLISWRRSSLPLATISSRVTPLSRQAL
jgi:hypothetical protein